MRTMKLAMGLAMTVTLLTAQAQESAIETQALRCSGLSLIHSTLTVPSPQFGEVMGEVAGLFAQIHAVHKGMRTKTRMTTPELRSKRDAMVSVMSKGWPGNKTGMIQEAAVCNAWRVALFSTLPEKPDEKTFQAAIANIGAPPATVSKAEVEKWTTLTPQAFAAWSQIKVGGK